MKKINNKNKGKKGENEAYNYLIAKGYRIIQKNYLSNQYEIDLIALKDGILIFIEVKTRKNKFFGFPEDAVNQKKIDKILDAAEYYILDNDWHGEIRFDIISIIESKDSPEITHFEDAF